MVSQRARYITQRTLAAKTRKWQALLGPYLSERRSRNLRFHAPGLALLVVDMQRFFLDPASHAYVPAVDAILGNVQDLLAACRSRGLPVVFTRHALLPGEPRGMMEKWWGDVLMETDQLAKIPPEVGPLPGDLVVRKARYSAFVGTDLDALLRKLGVTRLLICGVLTHLCCESTARDAFMRDFAVFFVIDATATQDERLHTCTLVNLTDGFVIPVTTEEVVKCLTRRR